MAKKIIGYFALGFGQIGCMPNGLNVYAVSTRREVCDAIREQFYDDPRGAKRALADLGIRQLWAHAKRWGFSSIGRELDINGTNEILNFMGLTEAEYNEHLEYEDY